MNTEKANREWQFSFGLPTSTTFPLTNWRAVTQNNNSAPKPHRRSGEAERGARQIESRNKSAAPPRRTHSHALAEGRDELRSPGVEGPAPRVSLGVAQGVVSSKRDHPLRIRRAAHGKEPAAQCAAKSAVRSAAKMCIIRCERRPQCPLPNTMSTA